MKRGNWTQVIAGLFAAAGLVGLWVILLSSSAIDTFTRGSINLFHPSTLLFTMATFIMLAGVVLGSIQVTAIIERLLAKR